MVSFMQVKIYTNDSQKNEPLFSKTYEFLITRQILRGSLAPSLSRHNMSGLYTRPGATPDADWQSQSDQDADL